MARALTPLPLFHKTVEHDRALFVLKSQYTTYEPAIQCLLLTDEFNKPFEYETDVYDAFVNTEKDIWEACIWDPNARNMCDILIAIEVVDAMEGNTSLVARHSIGEVVVTESKDGSVSMPLSGIPTIALQYCKLFLVYEGPIKPLGVKLRCRLLPSAERRHMAQISHKGRNYIISRGMLCRAEKEKCCVIN
jgi:hypothetical protein